MSNVSFGRDRFYVPPSDETDDQSQKRRQDEEEGANAASDDNAGKLEAARVREMILQALGALSAMGRMPKSELMAASRKYHLDLDCVLDILGLSKKRPYDKLFAQYLRPARKMPALKKDRFRCGKNSNRVNLDFVHF